MTYALLTEKIPLTHSRFDLSNSEPEMHVVRQYLPSTVYFDLSCLTFLRISVFFETK